MNDRIIHEQCAQLEQEIRAERKRVARLVSALEDRLSPGQLFERALDASKSHGGEFARNLGHAVKANPVPTLMTAAGMAWLYAGKDRQPATASDGDGRTSADGIGERAHEAADAIRDRADRARDGFTRMLDDRPLAVGAMAVAAGALLGAVLPETRKEDELLGEKKEELRQRARTMADRAGEELRRADREAEPSLPGHAMPRNAPVSGTAPPMG